MNKQKQSSDKTADLRKKAEKKLGTQLERLQKLSARGTRDLVQELGTHQIELEMQNEELRKAQEDLEASRDRYADLYDFAPVGYLTLDTAGVVREANLTAARMLNIARRYLTNKPFSAFVSKPDSDAFHLHCAVLLEDRTPQKVEVVLKRKDGAGFGALLESVVVEDADGNAIAIRTAVSDINERRKAEDALQLSELRYRSLFENMLGGYAFCRMQYDKSGQPTDFVYLSINGAFERLTGLKDVVGRRVTEVFPGIREAHPELLATCGRVAATGRTERFEVEFKPLGMWLSIAVYSAERGHFTAVFDDITERKKAAQALSKSEERFRLLVEQAVDGIFLADAQGRYIDINTAGERMLGYTQEEICRLAVSDVIAPEDVARMPGQLSALAGGSVITSEWQFRRKDGSTFIGEVVGRQLPDGRLLGILRDITGRKKAEEALLLLNEELEHRVTERTEDLRNLQAHIEAVREGERAHIAREVHDQLGQSMTALKMDIAWLKRNHPSENAAVRERTGEMLGLINGAIDAVKRIASELRPTVLDDFGLQAAVEWAAKEFEKRSGVVCRVLSRPANIAMDRTRSTVVYRVLQESLTNVARHAQAQAVTISLDLEGERFHMTVQDDGKGIAEDRAGDPSSYGLKGMQERVRFLGGDFRISGGEGRGTTVIVSLPMSGSDRPHDGAHQTGPMAASNELPPDRSKRDAKEDRS